LVPLLHMAFHHQVSIPLNESKITLDSPISLTGHALEKGFLPL